MRAVLRLVTCDKRRVQSQANRTLEPKRPKKGKSDDKKGTESWRLSDAHDTPKQDGVESVTEHGSADPNSGNPQQDAEPLPAVEIRYPKGIEDDARAYKRREQRRDRWKVFLEALTVVGVLGYGAIAYRQWHTMLAASDNSTKALEATERAYVDSASNN